MTAQQKRAGPVPGEFGGMKSGPRPPYEADAQLEGATAVKLLRRYTANDHVHGGCDELTQEAEDFLESLDAAELRAAERGKEVK